MKKIVYFWVATFLMLFATSCQKEVGGDNATVSFNIGTPKIATRAFSDGTTATVLQYAVYDAEGNELTDFTVTDGVIHGSTVVNFNLVTGNTYSVIFWAAAENAPYAIDFEQKTMTVDYENASCNDERRDAFYAYHTFTVTGAQTETIELKRPFAQINIGTNDYAAAKAAGYEPTKSSVKVNSVFTTFNFVDGTVSGDTTVTYDYVDIVKDSFPVVGYEYLAMNYVLVAAEKTVVDVEFAHTAVDASTAKTRTVGSVPVQRNYRTNIYGKLLTSDVEINVVIVPEYEDEQHNTQVLDPSIVAVSTNDELKDAINNNKDVILLSDITLEEMLEIPASANITLNINNNKLTINSTTTAILVPENTNLNIVGGGTLVAVGEAGSGIGGNGNIFIDGLTSVTAKGNGNHAFGIGGNGANVTIKNSTVDYACGGYVQPLFINDTKYGKSEPEGGAGIGGANITIENSTITKVDGGSKSAAIGAQYWQSTDITIKNSTILEANGGNASAGIGGSRYNGESKYNVIIKIENSNITATGGQGGAGIGSGYDVHCNQQGYTAINHIEIDATSTITATGGKYAAGIGTGFHSAYLTGSIATGATINAESGEKVYKDTYTTAQNIGYGVVDPDREFSGENANVTFAVNGNTISNPTNK